MNLRELRDRVRAVSQQMIDLNRTAETENRSFTTDEQNRWDTFVNEQSDLEARIARAEQVEQLEGRVGQSDSVREADDRQRFQERRRSHNDDPRRPLTEAERERAFRAWALGRNCTDQRGIELVQRAGMSMQIERPEFRFSRGHRLNGVPMYAPHSIEEANEQAEIRRAYREQMESRAQAVGFTTGGLLAADGSAGGYMVPDEMMGPFERALLQFGGMRQVATIISTATGADLPMPGTNDTANEGEIVGENVGVAEQDIVVSEFKLGSFKFSSKMVKVSIELLQDSAVNVPALLGELLGERIGRYSNRMFTVGTGTNQPRGIVTDAVNSTVTTSVGSITYAQLLDIKHKVDPAYRGMANWMFADPILVRVKKLLDTTGRPIFVPSIVVGEPGTIDGDAYVINQHMPTNATGKGILYGDMSKYMIREVMGLQLIRLDERYAESLQVAFIAIARMDGKLRNVGGNPVVYATLA